MKQRVCIAMVILLGSKVIIADEPTSALDEVTQRQVMQTVRQQQEQKTGSALILNGHDIGLMAQFVRRLAVMYAGVIVEIGGIRQVLARPRHPYTGALIGSIPKSRQRGVLGGIPGDRGFWPGKSGRSSRTDRSVR